MSARKRAREEDRPAMHKIVCDKCGRDDLAPLRPERFAVNVTLPNKTVHVDLCERCAPRLERWLAESDPREMSA